MARNRKQVFWKAGNIARSAVRAFLARDMENWAWIKEVAKPDLFSTLRRYGARFHTLPMEHQAACMLVGLSNPTFQFLLDMGTGKTKIILDLIKYRVEQQLTGKTLVLVPAAINIDGWEDELKIHAPKLSYISLVGSKAQRFDLLERDADVYLLTYPGLQTFGTRMGVNKKGKKVRVAVRKAVLDFASNFHGVVFDESHLVGNYKSLTYKLCRTISRMTEYRYGLTGTPFGRDPTMLWSQFDLIDHGATLGTTLGLFRAAFFTQTEDFWGHVKYNFMEKMEPELHRILNNRSIRYEDLECSDLPPKIPIKIHVDLPSEASGYYQKVRDQLREAYGNYEETENSFIRMRQLTSGYMTLRGDDSERIEIQFDKNPKLDALISLLKQIPQHKKVVIFYEYKMSAKIITAALRKERLPFTEIKGGDKEQKNKIAQFKQSKKDRIAVYSVNVGKGTGANLQIAKYMIFYESPVSPITRKQAEKRSWRIGQDEKVYVYDIVARGTEDERVLQFIAEGKNLFEAICNGQARV